MAQVVCNLGAMKRSSLPFALVVALSGCERPRSAAPTASAPPVDAPAVTLAGPTAVGSARAPLAAPRGVVTLGGAGRASPEGSALARVHAMKPQLLACYEAELSRGGASTGTLRLTVKLGPEGTVLAPLEAMSEGLGDAVVACCVEVVRAARFAPPLGGGAKFVLPISFRPR